MLVVVEDRDVAALLERLLDLEALGRLDVLEVDAAERRREQLAEADHLFRVFGFDLDVEHVDVGETLEQDALALHHRLAGQRADIPEAEHGGPIGHDRDEVALVGVLVGELGVLGDVEARLRHARCVGQRQIALGGARFGGDDLGLPVSFAGVIGEGFLAGDLLHDVASRSIEG